jgi:hypothetical protein
MVSWPGAAVAATHHSVGLTIFGIVELLVIIGWVALFAILLGSLAVMTIGRSRSRRRSELSPPVPPDQAAIRAALASLRSVDPLFDQQLLLDAARTATMLIFAASSTGAIEPISRLVTESFWTMPFGRILSDTARDRRRENLQAAKDHAAGRQIRRWNIPLDYQGSVPEVVAVSVDGEQAISVRISISQLAGLVRPAAGTLAMASAAGSFQSAMVAVGKSVATQANTPHVQEASWLSSAGHFELQFVRPGSARTDPAAALADRTCIRCGAAYRSEMATSCSYCSTARPMPWGDWRLAKGMPVR